MSVGLLTEHHLMSKPKGGCAGLSRFLRLSGCHIVGVACHGSFYLSIAIPNY